MGCRKCKKEIPDGSLFCPWCGISQSSKKRSKGKKNRGNGQGSAYPCGKGYAAAKVFGYKTDDEGNAIPIRVVKKGFATKTAALQYLQNMQPPDADTKRTNPKNRISSETTVKEMYDFWFPTHIARGKSKSTLGCYSAAIGHFSDIWDVPFNEIGIDDWQDCIDDCGLGRRTKENMKALVGLLYKYAIPRHGTEDNINLGGFLFVTGENGRRHPFSDDEMKIIKDSIGKVDYADYIYCNCYLGYRPGEFISRTIEDHYNFDNHFIIGGIKTKAGKTRVVTISPKIQPYIDNILNGRTTGCIFCRHDGRPFTASKYRKVFAEALQLMGINSTENHKLTPYSCRHTFASMADKVVGYDNAKIELMGHTKVDMLRHYQHADLEALRSVTNNI